MIVRTKDVGEGGLPVDLPVTAAWLARECPEIDARPGLVGVALRGVIEKSGGDGYLLRGKLSGALEASCSRCLESARVMLDADLAVSFTERDDLDEEEQDGGDAVVAIDGGEIDLGAQLREEILLAMPISVLCRPDCAGLCPVCGVNRNQNPCDCLEKQRITTGKLSALGKLKI